MRIVLLGAAATAAAMSAPAAAIDPQHWGGPVITSGPGIAVHSGSGDGSHRVWRRDRDRDGRHRRRHDRDGPVIVGGWGWDNGAWAYYNNRSFDSDSYNDWWHDRPDRAYPRWVRHNQNCDRMWWGGGVWRCDW